ncbi:MAG: hypothetical protein NPIRA02_37480 [Nitrospirales bacterium]|nr:MAG: hypothetical protein NPIRA02_37480 [Nitrospirales bacterium]
MKHGDIHWYRFSQPDKKWPVVILTRDSAFEWLSEVTVAPITSIIRDIPSEVALTTADGLPKACAINFDHLQTVSKSKIGPRITSLSPKRLADARIAYLFTLGF